jgi:primosomal protein N'
MATKSENADIAVLQTQMANVEAAVRRIETKIDNQSNAYVTHSEFDSYKKSQTWQKVSLGIASVIIGALVTYFFSTVGK